MNPSLGIVLSYDTSAETASVRSVAIARSLESLPTNGGARGDGVSVIGAGNYAGRILLPALARAGAQMRVLVSATGVSSVHQGRRFRFAHAATDPVMAIEDAETAGIVIATRHDSHADLAIRAMEAGKSGVRGKTPGAHAPTSWRGFARHARRRPSSRVSW